MPIKRTYASHGDACATSHAMELLGDRWTYPVIRELLLAPKRFAELEACLPGITPAVLTARLRQLEGSGLVVRTTLPAPAGVAAYAATNWAKQLQPIFEALARWALGSPLRDVDGCGLTPDAIVQSMLTMAPAAPMNPPLDIELRLADTRLNRDAPQYGYRLRWDDELTIERAVAESPQAAVVGDSSAWAGVLYEGSGLDVMEVCGDRDAVERLVAAFAGVLEVATL
ncbi:transcriptional regulator [Rhodococcus rhodnii]|uniref:Transcriptional regulator n=2 Tax=Rhodococcus rhodnii TaxID=38312 RepID=R7WTR4_9NOCA|nr:helix-turn-helix domain-containing protein [Rhodococcus rhodnii]EOM77539.1 transcriptional regulator [Rhodococcus rhodnii LMG 5362]TXG90093.1 transcriptional regulator [Rhodococcus rhodnii]